METAVHAQSILEEPPFGRRRHAVGDDGDGDDNYAETEGKEGMTKLTDEHDELKLEQRLFPLDNNEKDITAVELTSRGTQQLRLPPEILASIFVLTLDNDGDGDDLLHFPPDLSKSPWVLRRVCSAWRHVAVNEPLLWNSVDVTVPIGSNSSNSSSSPAGPGSGSGSTGIKTVDDSSDSDPSSDSCWKLINHVLHPTAPLSVSIRCHSSSSSWRALESFLVPQIKRIRHLNLLFEVNAFTKLLDTRTTPVGAFSALESLRLDLWSGKSSVHHRNQQQQYRRQEQRLLQQHQLHPLERLGVLKTFRRTLGFQGSTSLRTVDLSCRGEILFSDALLALPLAWSKLTLLRLTKLQPLRLPDVRLVLGRCFALVDLHVAFYYRGVLGAVHSVMDEEGNVDADDGSGNGGSNSNSNEGAPLDLPYLKYVAIQEYIPVPHSLFDLKLPWGSLVRVQLHQLYTLSLPEAYRVMVVCAETVEELSMHVSSSSSSAEENPLLDLPLTSSRPGAAGVVTLPRLRNLDLHVLQGLVFGFFSAPVLDTLTISGRPIPLVDIANMIRRSGCELSSFTYYASQTVGIEDRGVVEELLVHLGSVEGFQVPNMVLDARTVEAMKRREVLPEMTRLVCELRSRTLGPFVELVEARSREGVCALTGVKGPALKSVLGTYLMDRSDSWDVARDAACRVQKLNDMFKIITRI